MTKEDRDEMIAVLILITGWSPAAFELKTDRQIAELYDRYVIRSL